MFTVEFDYDSTSIISIDETDTHEDVEMILADDGTVFIRQFDDNMDEFQLIYISYQQLIDLVVSLRQTEGAYYHKRL
jgi:hypothetical protein